MSEKSWFDGVVESYLTTLAFTESPEEYQVPGEFDVTRFHFTRATRARAKELVQAFLTGLDQNRAWVGWADAEKVGGWIVYACGSHGTGIRDDLDRKTWGDVVDGFLAVAEMQPTVRVYFGKRRGKIQMSYDP